MGRYLLDIQCKNGCKTKLTVRKNNATKRQKRQFGKNDSKKYDADRTKSLVLYVQYPIFFSNLLYNMGNYFLDNGHIVYTFYVLNSHIFSVYVLTEVIFDLNVIL